MSERLSRLTADLVADALLSRGAPPGVFSLVTGFEAGNALIDHPAITAASFTGSLNGGRALYDRAAGRPTPIPFFAEMGSVNPVVITRAADTARGAELAAGLAGSFQLGAGQFCTKPGVVFVPRLSRTERALAGLVGTQRSRMLTPSIAEGFQSGLRDLLGVPGLEVLAGGKQDSGPEAQPIVLATTVQVLIEHADTVLTEVFGPVTVLVRYGDETELLAALDLLEGSLTATIHSEPDDALSTVVARLEQVAGRLLFGGWPTGVAVAWSQHHGGPWPSTSTQHSSVGATAVRRFQRPVAYQDAPQGLLPEALRDGNPLGIPRRINGVLYLGEVAPNLRGNPTDV
ncbi:MAG: aldehyde dehydrogenase [Subtercola sp.]|nr:aldehyde dehydrogenase [Subtercola sp.]